MSLFSQFFAPIRVSRATQIRHHASTGARFPLSPRKGRGTGRGVPSLPPAPQLRLWTLDSQLAQAGEGRGEGGTPRNWTLDRGPWTGAPLTYSLTHSFTNCFP